MRYIKVFIDTSNSQELEIILRGLAKFSIAVVWHDWGVCSGNKIWIKFRLEDWAGRLDTWNKVQNAIDQLNNYGPYGNGPARYAMPCEIELYDTRADDDEPRRPWEVGASQEPIDGKRD